MPVYQLHEDILAFPHPLLAEPDGLLAIGGDLSVERILLAYRFGIFPWFNPGEMIMWYFTQPRPVIYPHTLKHSKSMRSLIRKHAFTFSINERFEDVILACRQVNRKGQGGSWISAEIVKTYVELHQLGYAHSVEVYKAGILCGGLYGLKLGSVFYGESMFSLETNASKFGFLQFARQSFEKGDLHLIDCQQDTPHMRTLGSTLISGEEFIQILRRYAH
jgi:leucyl/phenylalanyl-tRNA--protein transferase